MTNTLLIIAIIVLSIVMYQQYQYLKLAREQHKLWKKRHFLNNEEQKVNLERKRLENNAIKKGFKKLVLK